MLVEPADPRTRKLSKIRIPFQIDWGLGTGGAEEQGSRGAEEKLQ